MCENCIFAWNTNYALLWVTWLSVLNIFVGWIFWRFNALLMGAQWLSISGRVLDSRPRGRGFKPYRRHCVVSLSKTQFNPSLVLAQPRKTQPYITERLLMGRKESNQANITLYTIIAPFDAFKMQRIWEYFGKWIIFSKVFKTLLKFFLIFFNVVYE